MNDEKPLIYLITRGNLTSENYYDESKRTLQLIQAAAENQIPLVQIREKSLPARYLENLLSNSIDLCKGSSTNVLVNDRFDIALSAHANGVHLTSNSIPTDVIRKLAPDDFVIGVSTHSLEGARRAQNEGADFATYSPIFPTISKPNYGEPKGPAALKRVCRELSPFPIIALGGIRKDNYKTAIECGASGFAAITFLNDENSLQELAVNS